MTAQLWKGAKDPELNANLRKISEQIDKNNFDEALRVANGLKSKTDLYDAAANLVLWNKYSQNNLNPTYVSFNDISKFVNEHSFFPNLPDLRKNVEKVALSKNIPYTASEKYFKNYPATSTESKLYLLKSKMNYLENSAKGNETKEEVSKNIQDSIVNIWINENFSESGEKDFLDTYGSKLSKIDHVNRIRRLLWDNRFEEAKKNFYLVDDEDYKKLFLAIIEISKNPKTIDAILTSVPRRLRNDEGLYYRKITWYKSQNLSDEAIELLKDVSANVDRPNKWWSLRKLYSREMLKKKEYKTAYIFSADHGLDNGSADYAEAEWTAGWIALRFLDKPMVAYNHFNNLYLSVTYPVSISRAAYWLGMAAEAMKDEDKAIEWYKVAVKYPTYFYGQLAIHKHRVLDSAGSQADIILPSDPEITGSDIKWASNSMPVKMAYLLYLTGDRKNAVKVFEYAVNKADSEGQIAVIMKIVNELDDAELDAKVSRFAAKRNVFFIKDKFQIVKEVENDPSAPLVHAIIKQESGFSKTALSSVGAIGFMQLMPDTAKLVCKQLGIKYDRKKLSQDIKYNVILGSFYIKSLIDKFEGSEILAIASYNAGPNATQRWINEFYDPRKTNDIDKVVDWIELITYSETRNYVQRIMENLIVYKYIMSRSNYDAIR